MREKTESLSSIDYEALANLRYRIRRFRQFSNEAAEKLGLHSQQHQALLAIKGVEAGRAMTMALLAERLLLPAAETDNLVKSLETLGYVRTAADASARIDVRLTEEGEEILRRLTPAHLFEIREMAPDLMQALRVLQDPRRKDVAAWMQ